MKHVKPFEEFKRRNKSKIDIDYNINDPENLLWMKKAATVFDKEGVSQISVGEYINYFSKMIEAILSDTARTNGCVASQRAWIVHPVS